MANIRKILEKVYPKLRSLEEDPFLVLMRISEIEGSNPFAKDQNETYDTKYTLTCIYSEQPELVTSAANITTQQQMYFYLMSKELQGQGLDEVSMKDRFIFRDRRYRPVEIQDLFGMWKIRVIKE